MGASDDSWCKTDWSRWTSDYLHRSPYSIMTLCAELGIVTWVSACLTMESYDNSQKLTGSYYHMQLSVALLLACWPYETRRFYFSVRT